MLKRTDEMFFEFEKLLNFMAAIVILAIMLVGTFQVFGRKLLGTPVPGYVDIIEMTMTVFAFVAISYTQRLGGHVRMELILGRLKGRWLYTLEIAGTLTAMFVVAVLAYYAYTHFLRAWEIGDSTIDINLPIWPSKLLVPFAFGVLLVRLLIQLIGFTRLLINPEAPPLAVPHIETVDEQAQHEIDAGLAGEDEKVEIAGRRPDEVPR
ncbi:MAG: TRAP transporter small permease subunit [Hyphomicrobiaceae bacterium]